MTSYDSPKESKLVILWVAKHVDANTVILFRRNHITWERNDEFEIMSRHYKFPQWDRSPGGKWTTKTLKDIKKHDRAIHAIHLPRKTKKMFFMTGVKNSQTCMTEDIIFGAIVSLIIMSPVTLSPVWQRTYERTLLILRSRWQLFRIFNNEYAGTRKNNAQCGRCSQMSSFKTAQRDRCSFWSWRQ